MFAVFIFFLLITVCRCTDWSHDSYIEAYSEGDGTVYEGPYPHFPRMPMKNETVSPMMPFLLQLILIIAKIMLKFTIFKMIVKFVALLCLFLFIPTLRVPKARSFMKSDNKPWNVDSQNLDNSIDSLTVLVKDAVRKYKDMLT